jgi:hypothetical protein
VTLERAGLVERTIRIDFGNGAPHGGQETHGVPLGSQDKRELEAQERHRSDAAWACLEERDVDGGLLGLLLRITGDIVYNRDDLARLIFGREIDPNLFSDRIFIGPEAARHGFVYDHYPGRNGCVVHSKVAPAQYGNLHRVEEIRRDRVV